MPDVRNRRWSKAEQERQLRNAIAESGSIVGAARLLGISERTAHTWMTKYGLIVTKSAIVKVLDVEG